MSALDLEDLDPTRSAAVGGRFHPTRSAAVGGRFSFVILFLLFL